MPSAKRAARRSHLAACQAKISVSCIKLRCDLRGPETRLRRCSHSGAIIPREFLQRERIAEVDIENHEREVRRTLDRIRIEPRPELAMLRDGGPETGVGGFCQIERSFRHRSFSS